MNTKQTKAKGPEQSGPSGRGIDTRGGIETTDERCPDGLPKWVRSDYGFHHFDVNEMVFAVHCGLLGFDLPGFDVWLSTLDACGVKQELLERRSLAFAAFRDAPNSRDAIVRHLEWMHLRRKEVRREDFLLPLARTGKMLTDARSKPRRKEVDDWIEKQLARNPAVKSPDLWKSAPDWITDQIGERRFATRVTKSRKARANK